MLSVLIFKCFPLSNIEKFLPPSPFTWFDIQYQKQEFMMLAILQQYQNHFVQSHLQMRRTSQNANKQKKVSGQRAEVPFLHDIKFTHNIGLPDANITPIRSAVLNSQLHIDGTTTAHLKRSFVLRLQTIQTDARC